MNADVPATISTYERARLIGMRLHAIQHGMVYVPCDAAGARMFTTQLELARRDHAYGWADVAMERRFATGREYITPAAPVPPPRTPPGSPRG